MPKKAKPAMGQGLEALFLDNTPENTSSVSILRVSEIEPNPTQPRKHFDEESLATLAKSLETYGLLQPIAVREFPNGFYRIIAGERRWRAAKLAGLTEIPAIVYDMDDKRAAELALIENLQREDLNPMDEAQAYVALMSGFDMTQEQVSDTVGKSRSAVANAVRLMDLPEGCMKLLAENQITAGHARAVLSLRNKEDMQILADRIVAEEMSVREAETEAKRMNQRAETTEAEPKQETDSEAMQRTYYRQLERRMEQTLGRKCRITGKGPNAKIELSYSDADDLEQLLRRLCGEKFFD